MGSEGFERGAQVRVAALVGACFLLGSTGWLGWLYRIMELAEPAMVDVYTMVVGYLAQAAGIGAFMIVAWRFDGRAQRRTVAGSLVAYVALLEPALMADVLSGVLAAGWIMNVFCGFVQGFYLNCLAECVAENRRGTVFGCGYAASTLATWALSSVAGGALSTGLPCLGVCAILAAASIALAWTAPIADSDRSRITQPETTRSPDDSNRPRAAQPETTRSPDDSQCVGASFRSPRRRRRRTRTGGNFTLKMNTTIIIAAIAVVLVSLVKNAGFSFPTADLSGAVNLELSRLFYGIGLVAAGIVADRDRRYALALCGISLVVPFVMLALSGAGSSSVVLWAVGYLLFGFFAVWRVVLFADLAEQAGRPWLAGAGLLFGRIGDVLGTALCLALVPMPEMLILVTAILFVGAAVLLILLYQKLFTASAQGAAQRNPLGEFCAEFGLSVREREVLPLLVAGKTYAEIATELFVTESTVKFHARNIRDKTGCATRLEVADLYASRSR